MPQNLFADGDVRPDYLHLAVNAANLGIQDLWQIRHATGEAGFCKLFARRLNCRPILAGWF